MTPKRSGGGLSQMTCVKLISEKRISAMDMVPLTPERKAQLDDYARRHGKDSAAALDEVLADALAFEQQDYLESVEGIRRGYEDAKAGRARPAAEFIAETLRKYGLPG